GALRGVRIMLIRRTSAEKPHFSVCIPQYNRTSFLLEALKSIAAQSFKAFEICISDDRSTDGREEEIVDFLENSGLAFAYERHETNRRYDANIRASIGLASGKYCFLLGNDDALATPSVLEDLRAQIEMAGGAGVVVTNFEDFATGRQVRRIRHQGLAGTGAAVAAAHFRNLSFVSGIVFDRMKALEHATSRWDG